MSPKITPIELSEKELESLIVADPSQIEEGLKIISRQHPADSGPLDILAIDSEGSMVIIELKNEADEQHLDQGLRYYDWARNNLAWLTRDYSSLGLNCDRPIRLILVAPSFTDTVQRIAKYIDIELQLIEYRAIQDSKGEKAIMRTEIDFGQPSEPPPIPTIEKKLEYFRNKEVKDLFMTALDELKKRGVELRPISGNWISFWFKDKRFMYMCPKRNFFVAEILGLDDTWLARVRISSKSEWETFLQTCIQPYIAKMQEK